MSSAGLVWNRLSREIAKIYEIDDHEKFKDQIDKEIMVPIDLIDNGIKPEGQLLTFSHYISSFNPSWDSDDSYDDAFIKAVYTAFILPLS